MDGDPLGPGLDLVLGAEDAGGLRWADLAMVRGPLPGGTLAKGLPVIDGVHVLAWNRDAVPVPVVPQALPAVLKTGLSEYDLVILDLPRRPDALTGLAGFVDLGLIVVPAEVSAASAAAKVAIQIYNGVEAIGLVIRGPAPTGLTAADISAALGLPILAQVRAESGLAAALDRGEPPGLRTRGPLARACRAILEDLAERHAR